MNQPGLLHKDEPMILSNFVGGISFPTLMRYTAYIYIYIKSWRDINGFNML